MMLKRMRRLEEFMRSIVSSEADSFLKQAELKVVSSTSEDETSKVEVKQAKTSIKPARKIKVAGLKNKIVVSDAKAVKPDGKIVPVEYNSGSD